MVGKLIIGTSGWIKDGLCGFPISSELLIKYSASLSMLSVYWDDLVNSKIDIPDTLSIIVEYHSYILALPDDFFERLAKIKNIKMIMIGCIWTYPTEINIRKLDDFIKNNCNHDYNFSFIFAYQDWYESESVKKLFLKHKRCVIVTPYLENSIIMSGWAHNIKSTRTCSQKETIKPIVTSNFQVFVLHGTLGPNMGSYIDHRFLQRFLHRIKKLLKRNIDIYCIFTAMGSMNHPIPPQISHIGFINPSFIDTVTPVADTSTCYIDANIFQIMYEKTKKYDISEDGYVDVKFVYDTIYS